MREQAKKMNVASLRSGENQGGTSAEAKLAKVLYYYYYYLKVLLLIL